MLEILIRSEPELANVLEYQFVSFYSVINTSITNLLEISMGFFILFLLRSCWNLCSEWCRMRD